VGWLRMCSTAAFAHEYSVWSEAFFIVVRHTIDPRLMG
jgi:hypothetical protein